jgi:hypothetical protein
MMNKLTYVGIPVGLVVLASAIVMPLTSAWAWNGTQGCTPGYYKNNADTNPRIKQLYGINLQAAILQITGKDITPLMTNTNLSIEKAITLQGSDKTYGAYPNLYRALAAAVFNTYYGDTNSDGTLDINFIEPSVLTGYVQQALNGDVSGAQTAIDNANNLGCSVDAFGRVI